jgi:hypothetical protein
MCADCRQDAGSTLNGPHVDPVGAWKARGWLIYVRHPRDCGCPAHVFPHHTLESPGEGHIERR